jgi:hypothetical protein
MPEVLCQIGEGKWKINWLYSCQRASALSLANVLMEENGKKQQC